MIFYKNTKKFKPISKKDLVFSIFNQGIVSGEDDSVTKPTQCKCYFNLSVADGALKNGLGFEDFQVPASLDNLENCHGYDFASKIDEIDAIWFDRWFSVEDGQYYYQMMLMDSAFKIFSVPLLDQYNGMVWSRSSKVQSKPLFVCQYRIENDDCTLFFTKEGMIRLGTESEGFYDKVPPLISCVVHYDNFFGVTNTNRNTLIYTKNLNLKNWSDEESSTIEFLDNRGAFTKLVAFNDYVYLFRENGITRISLYTNKSDFSFTHLFTSPSKIYENSICVCGDKVLFVTRDGLYAFNGNSVAKVAENLNSLLQNLDNTNCSAACLDGKYYLATKCNFSDGRQVGCEEGEFLNNVLFQFDINTFDAEILRGVDIVNVLAIDTPYLSKLCACFRGENKQRVGQLVHNGKVFENSNLKIWSSFKTDLEYANRRKKIKEIILTTAHDVSVEIISDEEEKTYQFKGSEKQQRLPISVEGKTFQFIFKTDAEGIDLKKPTIIFNVA